MTDTASGRARGKRAAFFDMDKTVLLIDSAMSWMKFLRRRGEASSFELARAVYWSLLYKLALLDMDALAERLVADLKGQSERDMLDKCRIWHAVDVAGQVAPKARTAIAEHRAAGDVIVLLTASTQYAAEVVSDNLDIPHTLCSRLEVADGQFTGRLAQLCFGRHKVTLAEAFAEQHDIDLDRSSFYSDSYNDLPMLQRVGTAVAINPDRRLLQHARRAGWQIDWWAES